MLHYSWDLRFNTKPSITIPFTVRSHMDLSTQFVFNEHIILLRQPKDKAQEHLDEHKQNCAREKNDYILVHTHIRAQGKPSKMENLEQIMSNLKKKAFIILLVSSTPPTNWSVASFTKSVHLCVLRKMYATRTFFSSCFSRSSTCLTNGKTSTTHTSSCMP